MSIFLPLLWLAWAIVCAVMAARLHSGVLLSIALICLGGAVLSVDNHSKIL